MVEGAALGALADLVDSAGEYIEYWREHKAEEVVIRKHILQHGSENRGRIRQTRYITRGTVSKVLSVPPGFVLKDVEEAVVISDLSMNFHTGSTELYSTSPANEGEQIVRKVNKKFISFSSIDELEKAEHAENAEEPFRE